MQTEMTLLNDLEKQFLCVCRTKTVPDEDRDIELESVDEVIRFAKRNQIFSIFYHFARISENDLKVSDKMIEELHMDDEAACSVLMTHVKSYNARLESLDYSKPVALYVFCVYQGQRVFAVEDDRWYARYGIDLPEIAADKLVEDLLEEIVEARGIEKQRREEKRAELKRYMLCDPVFQRCTNQDFRHQYWLQLVEKQPEIRYLFTDPRSSRWYDISDTVFVEDVWREYRQRR